MKLPGLRQELFTRVAMRWAFNSFGLWLAGELIPVVNHNDNLGGILVAGLLLSAINATIKPIVVILALPAILVSLGLFTVFVNGLMVFFASKFVAGFEIETYSGAVLAGIIISLLNYWLTTYLEERIFKEQQ